MSKTIRVLTIRFDQEISPYEVHLFRGAIISSMGEDANILYHNHKDEYGFRYSYPLIQYKRINKKAAIVCIEDGVEQIGQFLTKEKTNYHIGDRNVCMSVDTMQPRRILVQVWESEFRYRMSRWLPLNGENYKKYTSTDSMVERVQLLERILKGNILSMCKGLGITLEKEIKVSIDNMSAPYLVRNKETKLMSFDIEFTSNVSLPNYIGLGKNASIGFGVVECIKKED